jgi:hypothetical protein
MYPTVRKRTKRMNDVQVNNPKCYGIDYNRSVECGVWSAFDLYNLSASHFVSSDRHASFFFTIVIVSSLFILSNLNGNELLNKKAIGLFALVHMSPLVLEAILYLLYYGLQINCDNRAKTAFFQRFSEIPKTFPGCSSTRASTGVLFS